MSAPAAPASPARSRTRVLVVGSVNIDDAVRVARFPGPGETVSARSADTALGGKGANQAVAAARAGAAVRMVGAVGSGDGAPLLAALGADGVGTEGVARLDGTPSGRAFVFIDDAAENSIVVVAGANRAIPDAAVQEACRTLGPGDVLLLQNEVPAATSRLAAGLAREAGAAVVWNAAPAPESSEELVDAHDLLLVNEHELGRIATLLAATDISSTPNGEDRSASGTVPPASPAGAQTGRQGTASLPPTATGTDTRIDRLLAAVASATGADVICTLGAEGAAYRVGGETGRAAARPVAAVDTTAAGDTFAGYFAALAELPLRERLRGALDAASLAVTRPGASPSIPAGDEVEALEPHSSAQVEAPAAAANTTERNTAR
ncbi:PfkB family carbohydrate kinase [Glycomyces sp. NPDC047369]